jgi:hypothetical protein
VCTFPGVNVSQRGSPDRGSSFAPVREGYIAPRRRRTLLAVRGALSATALGASSVLGAVGAFLALFPAALRPVPRGRHSPADARATGEASREPLAG